MKNIIKIALALAVLIIGIGVGFYNGMVFSAKKSDGGSAAGWRSDEEKLKQLGAPHDLYSLSGRVEKVQGNEIHFKADLQNPLLSDDLKVRIAVIDKDSKVVLYKKKEVELTAAERGETERSRAKAIEEKNSLYKESPECFSGKSDLSAKCAEILARVGNLEKIEIELNAKLDVYEKVAVTNLSLVEPGMIISVISRLGEKTLPVGEKIEAAQGEKIENTDLSGGRVDIAKEKRFLVESVELRIEEKVPEENKKPDSTSGIIEVAPGKFENLK